MPYRFQKEVTERAELPHTFIEILKRWPERQANEMMAWRIEEIAAVGGVNVEKNARDHYGLFLEQFLEECLVIFK